MKIQPIDQNRGVGSIFEENKGKLPLQEITELFEKYLYQALGLTWGDKNNAAYVAHRPMISKAKSNFSLFLKFSIQYRKGNLKEADAAFHRYELHLQEEQEKERITANRHSYLKMYAYQFRKHPNLKGYIAWLQDSQIKGVYLPADTYQQIQGHPLVIEFGEWLKIHSRLNRPTRYAQVACNGVSAFLHWMQEHYGQIQINAYEVNTYIKSQRHLSVSTQNKYLEWIKRFCTFYLQRMEKNTPFAERDERFHSAAEEIKAVLQLKSLEGYEQEVLRISIPDDHLEKMYALAEDRMALLLDLGISMGLRASSMLFLKVKDIDFSRERMSVFLKGRNQPYNLPVPLALLNTLKEWIITNKLQAEDRILGFKGDNTSNISSYFTLFLKKNGLRYAEKEGQLYKLSLHNLRHTFAYRSIDRFGLLMTSRLLCHQSVETTERHYLKDRLSDTLYRIYHLKEEEVRHMKNLY
ncbi:tyrosine-type recombinase/integrase [Algivirga pacifica]|uniref:Tyr recombinase domain-containing protein n=1 Tax=Algivirga pacifica TaxID=1162670 RepID=A0ABP9DQR3_9BACT